MGVLKIYLEKITNLVDEDHIGKSDPYVKFELEQDNMIFDKDYGDKTSSKKKDEPNPEYGEEFEFEIPELSKMVLSCKVMDDDIVGDDKIGKCKIDLEDLGLTENLSAVEKTVDNNWFSNDAQIFLKLSYTE